MNNTQPAILFDIDETMLIQTMCVEDSLSEIEEFASENRISYHFNPTDCMLELFLSGVEDALKSLKNSGYTLGVVTARGHQENFFNGFSDPNIGDLFSVQLGRTKIGQRKTELITEACNTLGVDAQNVTYAGDAVTDYVDCTNAGIGKFIAALNEDLGICRNRFNEFSQETPKLLFADKPEDIVKIIFAEYHQQTSKTSGR